jgi:hypothetical protein
MIQVLLKRFLIASLTITGILAGTLFISGRSLWAYGLALGASWSVLNILLTAMILRDILMSGGKRKINPALFLKLPYVALLALLVFHLRMLPGESVISGVLLTVLTIGVLGVCLKPA